MVECKSQASCTARRLVGQIRTPRDKTVAHQTSSSPSAGNQRRKFSYVFEPNSVATNSATGGCESPVQEYRHWEEYEEIEHDNNNLGLQYDRNTVTGKFFHF